MKQRIFSHFQDSLIQYISHQYQDFLYCNSSQYILSTYNNQQYNNNNIVLAMAMPYSGQGRRHSALQVVHYVFNSDHYIDIVIAKTTLLYKWYLVRMTLKIGHTVMKSIQTNPNSVKRPDKGKIVNKLYCILLTTLEKIQT